MVLGMALLMQGEVGAGVTRTCDYPVLFFVLTPLAMQTSCGLCLDTWIAAPSSDTLLFLVLLLTPWHTEYLTLYLGMWLICWM